MGVQDASGIEDIPIGLSISISMRSKTVKFVQRFNQIKNFFMVY